MTVGVRMAHGPTANRDYYGLRACPRCNRIYRAALHTASDEPCPDCKREIERAEKAESRGYGALKANDCAAVPFVVTYDPTGDFHPGASFATCEFCETLRAGVWDVGMMFVRAGKTYEVTAPGVIVCEGVDYIAYSTVLVPHGNKRNHSETFTQ